MLWKCCTQHTSKFGKLTSGHKTGKGQFSFQSKERQCQRMFKLLHNFTHLTQVMLRILQAKLVHELRNSRCSSWFQKRQRNQRSNCQHRVDHQKSKGVPEKHLFLLYWLCQNLWLWEFWKRWEYQTTWPTSWETCMQVRKQVRTGHGTTDWFQIGKGVQQAVYCHPAYLTCMQSTSWETLD